MEDHCICFSVCESTSDKRLYQRREEDEFTFEYNEIYAESFSTAYLACAHSFPMYSGTTDMLTPIIWELT